MRNRNKKESELIWEAFSTSQVQEEGLFDRNKKKRTREGLVTHADKIALKQDQQWLAGRKQKEAGEDSGVASAFTDVMDDYGYEPEDYAEPLTSVRHPDNIERESNPAHNYIRHQPESDKYTEEDYVRDHNGKTIKRKDINGGRDRIVRDAARHDGRGRTDDNAKGADDEDTIDI